MILVIPTVVPGAGLLFSVLPTAPFTSSAAKTLLDPPNGGDDGPSPPPPPQAAPRTRRTRTANLRAQNCLTDTFPPMRSVGKASYSCAGALSATPSYCSGNL